MPSPFATFRLKRHESARSARLLLAWATVMAGVTAMSATTAAEAVPPGVNGKIAFTRAIVGNFDIWSMSSDGTSRANLTNNPALNSQPSWSPNGAKIAFASDRDGGDDDIYVMNADGSGQTALTSNADTDFMPSWSPDGAKIAFASDRDSSGSNFDIYVMNADGTGPTRLTTDPGGDARPEWSPDGSKIAFESERDEGLDIYVMNANGSGQIPLTEDHVENGYPSWSPDGSKIAFESQRDDTREIYVMNADGTGESRITNNSASDSDPAWSPDGSKIAFESQRDDNGEIYVMNADGTGQTRITNDAGSQDGDPSWGPGTQSSPPGVLTAECSDGETTQAFPIECSVFVSAGTPAPTGTVSLAANSFAGTLSSKTCPVSSESSPCTFTYTPKGYGTSTRTDKITITYAGDSTYPKQTTTLTIAVKPKPAPVLNASCGDQTTPGVPVQCQVTVDPNGAGQPTGTVALSANAYKGTLSLESCPAVSTDPCIFTYTPKGTGTAKRMDPVRFAYSGDAHYQKVSLREQVKVTAS
ncbi:MAG: hypothetical protein WAL70_01435 [Aeromicrobium sp.]